MVEPQVGTDADLSAALVAVPRSEIGGDLLSTVGFDADATRDARAELDIGDGGVLDSNDIGLFVDACFDVVPDLALINVGLFVADGDLIVADGHHQSARFLVVNVLMRSNRLIDLSRALAVIW